MQQKHFAALLWKVLVKLFQKLAQVKGAKPFSPSAEGETPLAAFSFASFSLAPFSAKRKAAKEAERENGYRKTCRKVALFIRRGVL